MRALRLSSRALVVSVRSAGLGQAVLFLAFDLHDATVVHGDLHRAVAQIAQGVVDLAQQGSVIGLRVERAGRCAHGLCSLGTPHGVRLERTIESATYSYKYLLRIFICFLGIRVWCRRGWPLVRPARARAPDRSGVWWNRLGAGFRGSVRAIAGGHDA